MLDNNDLKQIKKIMDSGFEDFAIIVMVLMSRINI